MNLERKENFITSLCFSSDCLNIGMSWYDNWESFLQVLAKLSLQMLYFLQIPERGIEGNGSNNCEDFQGHCYVQYTALSPDTVCIKDRFRCREPQAGSSALHSF